PTPAPTAAATGLNDGNHPLQLVVRCNLACVPKPLECAGVPPAALAGGQRTEGGATPTPPQLTARGGRLSTAQHSSLRRPKLSAVSRRRRRASCRRRAVGLASRLHVSTEVLRW